MMIIDIEKLWAKSSPFLSITEHCVTVGRTAGILWDIGILPKNIIARNDFCLLASLHDIGKAHPYFQMLGKNSVDYIDILFNSGFLPELSSSSKAYRHEIGSEFILKTLRGQGKNNRTIKTAAKILRLHHQKNSSSYTLFPKKEAWLAAQESLITYLENEFKLSVYDINFQTSDAVCVSLWGGVILADWLASGGLEDKVLSLFSAPKLPQTSFEKLFNIHNLRPLQESCINLAKSFSHKAPAAIIIEAPMGEGKTEAAIYLAAHLMNQLNKTGIYVALPTMATARQMEKRLSDILNISGIGDARLIHSEAWLETNIADYEDIDKSWFAPTKRALLSNYAAGTIDQALMAVLKIKQGVLRLLGLSGKILIIDEAHAYDAYMQTIMFRLLEWCRALKIPVIILSATLPSERRNLIAASCGGIAHKSTNNYPLITTIFESGEIEETTINDTYMKKTICLELVKFVDYADTASELVNAVSSGGVVAAILNTVKEAQELYAACKKLVDEKIELILYHSRFIAQDRKIIEELCLDKLGKNSNNRPQRAIIIATQVMEQSLDVDFDFMISAIAPIDLLLQRAGRLHRHDRVRPTTHSKAKLSVLLYPQNDKAGTNAIYSSWILRQTEKELSGKTELILPRDIRPLIESVYTSCADINDESFEEWIKLKSGEQIMSAQAKQFIFPTPNDDCFFAFDFADFDFYNEIDDTLVDFASKTRVGGKSIRIAVVPNELWNNKKLDEPDIQYARIIMDRITSIPVSGEIVENASTKQCGGYLRGVYAVKGSDTFSLTTNYYSQKTRYFTVNKEYGIKEEQ